MSFPGFQDVPALRPELAWSVVVANIVVIGALIAALT